ncbi:Arylacetamide deacetylase [Collichthys lucidus]|uniref:Arylacetamide deacetylase n=1 Tax=Collichthys lucidus TaxID=240159 RepID=A0A4U5UZT6_COLLU|nr:Arylacetamide deacetylase [Collichthys lucidus]
MRLGSIFLFVALCSFTAYYIYEPIPEEIEERWKLMLTNSFFRSLSHLADLSELLGLKDYMGVMYFITLAEKVVPVSDEHVKVTEEKFDGVEVVLYQPQQRGGTELRRAIIYLHGGGWCLGSSRMSPYDLLARKMVTELDSVVLSVEYRLAPAHHFPVPYEDVYRVVKHFLQKGVLAQYSVDPGRIAVSGDSAGGNLAAAVSQQNQDMPILPRTLMVRFWSEYFTSDKALFRAMMANTHNNPESSSLLKFVNWSAFLPETYHKKYNYSAPAVVGMDGPSRSFADPRASPLLVPDTALHSLPKAYVLTWLMFTVWPTDFLIARRMTDNYVKWLKENL